MPRELPPASPGIMQEEAEKVADACYELICKQAENWMSSHGVYSISFYAAVLRSLQKKFGSRLWQMATTPSNSFLQVAAEAEQEGKIRGILPKL